MFTRTAWKPLLPANAPVMNACAKREADCRNGSGQRETVQGKKQKPPPRSNPALTGWAASVRIMLCLDMMHCLTPLWLLSQRTGRTGTCCTEAALILCLVIFSPQLNQQREEESSKLLKAKPARVAKLADARDLKSRAPKGAYRFNSGPGHHLTLAATCS